MLINVISPPQTIQSTVGKYDTVKATFQADEMVSGKSIKVNIGLWLPSAQLYGLSSGWLWGDGSTWGTTMTAADIALLRRLVREHKSAHDTCTYLYFAFATGAIFGAFVWGDGTLWGGVGNVVTLICGETWWEQAGYM
jgi:hypothetical protein